MWQVLIDHFRRYPAQERVVRLMIRYGLRIQDGKIHAGDIEVADTALGRAAGVDRRIVRSTIETIAANPDLGEVFARFNPTLHLKEVATALNCGVIEVSPKDAAQPGILAGVISEISSSGVNIRQTIVEDPEFIDEPRLFVVTERRAPPETIHRLQALPGVHSVTVY